MSETPLFPTLRRIAPDALVGLAVFVLVLLATAGDASIAAPASSETLFANLSAPALSGRPAMLILLAGVLSLLSALNLAFFRHILRTYARPEARKRGR